jgi:uncharacterized protein YegP (UPF0339 family)
MAITPQEFFNKNAKWFVLVLLALFIFKSIQSCNRGTSLGIDKKQYIHKIDSLENRYSTYYKTSQDSIKELNFLLKLANQQVRLVNDRADAIQHAVESVKSNTTVVVKGAEKVDDSKR